jgi:adenosine deaminase
MLETTPPRPGLIEGMPKAELHMHLEGSIEPERMFELARRNHIRLPWQTVEEARAAYRFTDLAGFLAIYYEGCKVLLTADDFFDLAWDYLRRVHAENVVHAEIFVSAQANTRRGVPLGAMMDGLDAALRQARERFGMTGALLLGLQRHFGPDDALATVEEARPWRDRIAGIGLGGAELPHPPALFERAFARARDLGWRTMAHAGEEGPAAYVADAVDVLKVDRIDHGVRCEDDPALMRRLADLGVPLTVCPVSNVKLGVFPSMRAHNIQRLLAAGLKVTVNSDDPSYFDAYMNENFRQVREVHALDERDLYTLVRNGFEAAFLPDQEKAGLVARLDAYWDGCGARRSGAGQ